MQNEKELRKGMYHLFINKHFKSKYFQNLGNSLIKLRWDLWANKFLAQLVSNQKWIHFLSRCENIKIKQNRFEIDYDNDQGEVEEHQIDKSELFHDPYPYDELEIYQLKNF